MEKTIYPDETTFPVIQTLEENGQVTDFVPAGPQEFFEPHVKSALYDTYEAARKRPVRPPEHVTQFIVKTVVNCNFRCSKDQNGHGYGCYEPYDDPEEKWRKLPPVMSPEDVVALGYRVGEHAAEHGLRQVGIVFHGGEPLFMHKPEDYYARIIPRLLEAVALVSPNTKVNLSIHTNGALLRKPILDVFKQYNVGVSVSLDGPAWVNDTVRVIKRHGQRMGTSKLVIAGLKLLIGEDTEDDESKHPYRRLFRGILAVIHPESDPVEVHESLKFFNPPAIDLLLPYATWDELPDRLWPEIRGPQMLEPIQAMRRYLREHGTEDTPMWPSDLLPADTPKKTRLGLDILWNSLAEPFSREYRDVVPYADWLLRFYQANEQSDAKLKVRFFNSIRNLALNGPSLVEGIGPFTGNEIVIRTDGSYELPDSLQKSYPDAAKLNMDIAHHSVGEVEEVLRKGKHLGEKALSKVCQECDLVKICGGGHKGTQYSIENGFDNPSVYCLDLDQIIRYIRAYIMRPQFRAAKELLAEQA